MKNGDYDSAADFEESLPKESTAQRATFALLVAAVVVGLGFLSRFILKRVNG